MPAGNGVIGRALIRSLAVTGAAGVAIAAGWLLARRPAPPPRRPEVTAQARVETPPRAAPPALPFTDVTAAAGVRFRHHNGGRGDKLLPETMGGGVAVLDYDADGDADLLFVNSSQWPDAPPGSPPPTMALYANDGRGRFRDVTREAGLAVTFYGMGAAVGDYDGDGWTDVFFTAVGTNHLFRNRRGVFAEVTAGAGVAGAPEEWSTSAAFFDVDRDGDLDLFVCNYVRWSKEIDLDLDFRLAGVGRAFGPPWSYRGTFPYLYRNDGDGTFTDVSAAAGVQVVDPATGVAAAKALALTPVDVDGDGWLDVVVANDTVRNFLFHNRGDGTFEEVGESFGVAYDRDGNATGAMGVDAAYYRNDANLGLLLGNFANEMSSVYVAQDDPRFFVDEALGAGIGAASRRVLTFGLFAFDADLDGRLDVLQANGQLEERIAAVDPGQSYRQPAQLFWNAGPERGFVAVPPEATGDLARPLVGRGAAYADLDGDGDLDVVLGQNGGAPRVLRNDQALGHHWLRLRLVGRPPNRGAIGARVELTAAGVTQRRRVMPTRSYLSQVELPVTFGLGAATAVDSLRILWPDGERQEVAVPGVDRLQVIEEQGAPAPP